MQTTLLHSLWITLISSFYTAYYCFLATIRQVFGILNRPWVDKTLQRWSMRLLQIAKVQYVVINPHNVQPQAGKATILMCNHSSLYDIPVSFKAFPDHSIRMLAKKELSKIPFMGKGMLAADFPFIDRKNRHQAIQDLTKVKQLMEDGIVMWICPEGTRSKDGKLASFKKGSFITAIEAQATIIPIGIRGAFEILPAKTTRFNINQHVEIHVGDAIDASLYTLETKDQLIQKTHEAMEALLAQHQK